MTELLAPAGSPEHVPVAVNAGADAIYLGGRQFNARSSAHNFDMAELAGAVNTAHLFGVKIYVTVNILMADSELVELEQYLKQLDRLRVDGIIVQDMAVAVIARRVAPDLPIHGSTQMTVSDLDGVRFLERLGFTQVVLSRELSIEEIRYICAHTNVKIEAFIHGASCMSYSGQCLMSSFIGGRSGNRGACAQPCRLPYTLTVGEKHAVTHQDMYILSLKDLNSLSCIDALIDAGVASFKIEGRMKGTEYVRTVVEAYKMVMEAHPDSPPKRQHVLEQAGHVLSNCLNRGYQHDFLSDTVGKSTITGNVSGNLYRVEHDENSKHPVAGLQRKLPLYFHVDATDDGKLRLTAWDESGHTVDTVSDYTVQKAEHHPAGREWVKRQIDRLGNMPFSVADVTIWDESYMIPASVMNGLRRDVAKKMEQLLRDEYDRPKVGIVAVHGKEMNKATADVSGKMELVVRCDSLEGVEAAARHGAARIIYGGDSYRHCGFDRKQWQKAIHIAHSAGAALWASSPRVLRQRDAEQIREELEEAVRCSVDGLYAGAHGIILLAEQERWGIPVEGDWSLNIFNAEAAAAFVRSGCSGLTLSTELMLRQIKQIAKRCTVPVEVLVQGRIEMMITEYCSPAAFAGSGHKRGCSAPCRGKTFCLRDRRNELFPVVTDQYCRNHILNSRDLDMAPYYADLSDSGIARIRIEGRGRTSRWIQTQTTRYRRLCDAVGPILLDRENNNVTRGHYFHGII